MQLCTALPNDLSLPRRHGRERKKQHFSGENIRPYQLIPSFHCSESSVSDSKNDHDINNFTRDRSFLLLRTFFEGCEVIQKLVAVLIHLGVKEALADLTLTLLQLLSRESFAGSDPGRSSVCPQSAAKILIIRCQLVTCTDQAPLNHERLSLKPVCLVTGPNLFSVLGRVAEGEAGGLR